MLLHRRRESAALVLVLLALLALVATLAVAAPPAAAPKNAPPAARAAAASPAAAAKPPPPARALQQLQAAAEAQQRQTQQNAIEFLMQHVKQQRTFACGFESPSVEMRMDGLTPPSRCSCRLAWNSSAVALESDRCMLPSAYAVSSASVRSKPFSERTKRHLTRLLGSVSEARMVRMEGAGLSCIDGRSPHASTHALVTEGRSLRTFGGDFGEFLLMLAVLNKYSQLYESSVVQLLRAWVDRPRVSQVDPQAQQPATAHAQFYFHSDVESLSRIAAQLGYDIQRRNATWKPLEDDGEAIVVRQPPPSRGSREEAAQRPFLDFTNPPLHLHDLLLEQLIRPENQGCAHLRMIMSFPHLYGIPLPLVQQAISAYFRILWNKDMLSSQTDRSPLYFKLKFVVSRGSHVERAWLNVRNTRECARAGVASVVPTHGSADERPWSASDALSEVVSDTPVAITSDLLDESAGGGSAVAQLKPPFPPDRVYMFHPQAAHYRRREAAKFIAGKAKATAKQMLSQTTPLELSALAETAQSRTQQLLMQNIPEYNVRVV